MAGNEEAAGGERGQKSKHLTQAEGGVLDEGEGYVPLTEGVSEQGVFQLVGGYLDSDGVVHKEVHLRAMSGHEEDLLSNDSVPFFQRMTGILSQCCIRIGTIEDRGQIIKAIRGLPAGSRQHLLICLRRASHWRTTKDYYDMKVECPKCEKDSDFKVNLGTLDTYEMPDATKRVFEGELPDAKIEYVWKITSFEQDEILSAITQSETAHHELLTWSILIRLVSLGGDKVEVKPSEVVDQTTGQLLKTFPKRILEMRQKIKNLTTDDRQFFRDEFMEHEPGVETDIDFKCPKCKKEFVGRLDLGQRSFFFPSGRQKRSNRRSFT